ncbi:hypothetical protein FPV67DRAFT_1651324 [Lyophyllum atratum]|nr:hypothetical protein FPV67DRAFT_1651324 [Lyophyllum atratum]
MPSGHQPPSSSGLFSGVFSFVSREIESFVTTATGGTLSQAEEPESPPSPRVQARKKRRGDTTRKYRALRDDPDPRLDCRKQSHGVPELHHARPSVKRRARRPTPPQQDHDELSASDNSQADPPNVARHTGKQTRREHTPELQQRHPPPQRASRPDRNHTGPKRTSRRQSDTEEPSDSERSSSPSPPPPPPKALRRRQSVSMPGSLFPRSPSLIPEDVPVNNRHVRFESDTWGSSSTSLAVNEDDTQPGPSRRPRPTSSVKAAVDRFHVGEDDADPSILLPSPTGSPAKMKRSYSAREKGKGRAMDLSFEEGLESNTSGEIRVRGKERELAAAKADQRRRETRDEEQASGSDEELEREKGHDKERIRMLEEEITRLKEELSKRPRQYATTLLPPPPPPPPPMNLGSLRIPTAGDPGTLFASARAALKHAPTPVEAPINPPVPTRRKGQPAIGIAPDKMAAFLTEMKTVRLKKVSGNLPLPFSGNSSFSHESSSSGSRIRDLPRRSMSSQVSNSRSTDAWDPRVGDKRKRGEDGLAEFRDDLRATVKRRSIGSSDSSFASNTSLSQSQSQPYPHLSIPSRTWSSTSTVDAATPSLCSDNDVDNNPDDERLPSTPPIPPFRNAFRFRANGVPVKPDPDQRILGRHMKAPEIIDVDMYDDRGMLSESHATRVNMSMMPPPPPPPPVSPHAVRLHGAEVFAKRPPTSPMPNRGSPVKPRPPARARAVPAPQRRPANSDEEVDPLSLSFEELEQEPQRERSTTSVPTSRKSQSKKQPQPSRIPKAAAKPAPRGTHGTQPRQQSVASAASRTSARSASVQSQNRNSVRESRSQRREGGKRRLTLDEELRDAGIGHHEDEDVDGLESGVFVGVGTRSKKRGFLAHGGAGGAPVFMGVGYVEGAEDDREDGDGRDYDYGDDHEGGDDEEEGDDDDDDEYLP